MTTLSVLSLALLFIHNPIFAGSSPPANFCPVVESTCAVPDKALTLADCYRLALQQSETVAIRKEQLAETEARFHQALSGILPKLDFVSTDKRQDSNGAGGQFTLTTIHERKFSMNQPLFSGFKEFASMSGAKAQRRQREDERLYAEELLFIDVSDAFYLLLEQREDLKALQDIRKVLADRMKDLTDRAAIGRSRSSEVTSAETQLDRVEADIELIRGQETTARQLLEFLTGRPLGEIADPLTGLPSLNNPSDYLGKAGLRPEVRAAEEAVRVAQKQVTYTKGDYWPNASLQGNYYTQRSGVLQGIDWDAAFLLDLPIFSGGATKGNVDQTKAQLREAELERERLRRAAVREIKDAYAKTQAALERTKALRKAFEAAEKSHQLQIQDYRRNLVNNLDVLQALQTLEDVRRDHVRSQYEVKRLYWRLKSATGETP